MMGSAQLELEAEAAGAGSSQGPAGPRQSALHLEVAEKLAAHRRRRGQAAAEATTVLTAPARSPRHRIAAQVAERYAQTPSYRAFLAEQAKRAIEEAAAAAEVAVRNAEAVAAVQGQLLGELELWVAPQEFTAETAVTVESPRAALEAAVAVPAAAEPSRRAGLTVRLYEDLQDVPAAGRGADALAAGALRWTQGEADEAQALDAEIAFRQAPVFEDFHYDEPHVALPANLLEFPRQLIAARRARPRLAEGPLADEVTPKTRQLRIFEVEPEQISSAPAASMSAPEWHSIRLDAHTVTEPVADEAVPALETLATLLPPHTAPLSLRLMATLVDGTLVGLAFVAFVGVFAEVAGEIPLGVAAALAGLATLAGFYLVYQALFFTLSGQTPGMRYARIGLCTFSDENPSRSAMRRRILAQVVAACPLGLGLVWALLDDDGLGWHDRISRMYQRAY